MLNFLDDSQFQPPQVYAEGAWLYGAFITAILYGIIIILYGLCTYSLWGRIRSHDSTRKKQWFLFIYVNFVFAWNTFYVVTDLQFIQLGFINNRNYPGGPSAYELNTSSAPLNVAFVVSNWCTDALMIWRCVVVYRNSKFHPVVVGFGCLMLLASIVTGSLWVVIASGPTQSETGWMSFSYLFPYLSVSLSINILVCILTVLRLLYHRACISKAFGPEYGMLYTSFAAMIIESAAVYSICSLLFLIPYAVSSPLANASSQFLCEAQVIASLLIIYRVSEGKAWTRDMDMRLAASGSYALRGLATQTTSITLQPPRLLDVQVALQGVQHTECGASTQLVDEEDKDLAV